MEKGGGKKFFRMNNVVLFKNWDSGICWGEKTKNEMRMILKILNLCCKIIYFVL